MKRLFIFSTFLLLLLSTTFPQQSGNTIKPNLKYGKPSKEELSLNSYAPDTTATAIYLFRMGESKFVYKDGFQLVTEHWVRIKVLKPQGVSYADVTIPYYSPSDKDRGQERASEINGCSYHLENGQCIETPLKRDHISDERVNQHIRLLKFSIPSVKVGSVIEYHYKLYSDYFAHIDNWMMQDELPMIYNQYKITIPPRLHLQHRTARQRLDNQQSKRDLHTRNDHPTKRHSKDSGRLLHPVARNDLHLAEPPRHPAGRVILLVSRRL
ncbi:DUF3857 domain-containing protein [Bacteroides faecis]|uniref:DUF3857 domain-containing protein n=1 Tax=Bacteroides faecis TaxID=674529 RepID=UPI0021F99D33|nr:DUF3857 domain-containing protein [Bacteroides faecis]MCS3126241.1 DUF3857 domain-containing protein [Bacteroides faecis]UVP33475.1 DUF3857 domain-containing protein [Bacteroides faecis]